MPFNENDLKEKGIPISFLNPGEVRQLVGPCSAKYLKNETIPLDGRHYSCAGKLILPSGKEIRANFNIQTHNFDFLERDSVYCFVNGFWYNADEPELLEVLGLKHNEFFPYKWLPDKPLQYHVSGPYPMEFKT